MIARLPAFDQSTSRFYDNAITNALLAAADNTRSGDEEVNGAKLAHKGSAVSRMEGPK